MFRKPSKTNAVTAYHSNSSKKENVPSIMMSDINVLGNIICEGTLDFNGTIDGNIRCKNLTIRENALVKGEVIADTVQVHGKVSGLIRARVVHLFATARIDGVIMHESLSIEDGAFIDGKLKRTDKIKDEKKDIDLMFEDTEEPGSFKALENLRLISA